VSTGSLSFFPFTSLSSSILERDTLSSLVSIFFLPKTPAEFWWGSGGGWPAGAAAPPRQNPNSKFLLFFAYSLIHLLLSFFFHSNQTRIVEYNLVTESLFQKGKKRYITFLLNLWFSIASTRFGSLNLDRFRHWCCWMRRAVLVLPALDYWTRWKIVVVWMLACLVICCWVLVSAYVPCRFWLFENWLLLAFDVWFGCLYWNWCLDRKFGCVLLRYCKFMEIGCWKLLWWIVRVCGLSVLCPSGLWVLIREIGFRRIADELGVWLDVRVLCVLWFR